MALINFEVENNLEDCIKIDEWITELARLKELGATKVEIYARDSYGNPLLEITAEEEREETEQEIVAKKQSQIKNQQEIVAQQRQYLAECEEKLKEISK